MTTQRTKSHFSVSLEFTNQQDILSQEKMEEIISFADDAVRGIGYYKGEDDVSYRSQYRRKFGVDFNFPLPRTFAIDFCTDKIMDIEYINLAQKFCKSRKSRSKARWLKKFSRKLTRMNDFAI